MPELGPTVLCGGREVTRSLPRSKTEYDLLGVRAGTLDTLAASPESVEPPKRCSEIRFATIDRRLSARFFRRLHHPLDPAADQHLIRELICTVPVDRGDQDAPMCHIAAQQLKRCASFRQAKGVRHTTRH